MESKKEYKSKRQEPYIRVATVCMQLVTLCSLAYCVICIVSGNAEKADIVAVLLNALVASLGFYAIIAGIRNDKEVKQFEFYADYNFNFLTNDEFVYVERMLESCNQEYIRINNEYNGEWEGSDAELEFQRVCDRIFHTNGFVYTDNPEDENSRIDRNYLISEDYQKIINYLVYLESFVPLLIHKQLHLEDVDDLFGYRYFIAVNNPVLQQNELLKESKYYNGCFKIYKEWRDYCMGCKYCKKRGKCEAGEKCVEKIPMGHYDLLRMKSKYDGNKAV